MRHAPLWKLLGENSPLAAGHWRSSEWQAQPWPGWDLRRGRKPICQARLAPLEGQDVGGVGYRYVGLDVQAGVCSGSVVFLLTQLVIATW